MNDLTNAICSADLNKKVNTYRQQLQVYYVESLINVYNNKAYDRISKSVILQQINRIDKQQRDGKSPDKLTRAHRAHIRHLIDQAWD